MSKEFVFMDKKIITTFVTAAAAALAACSGTSGESITIEGKSIENIDKGSSIGTAVKAVSKNENNANPLLADIFCADPTSVEYEGRLYVYGTNDNQQYDAVGSEGNNTYEKIKSFVMLSTEDMVNWTYHGTIDTEKISPWVYASWAPSIVSREEEDGKIHFYLYYSNSGAGVGVLTAESPVGSWSDPLGKPLVTPSTKGLTDCPNPFDPGVCIDENGVGWISLGGGRAKNGTDYMPGSARIARLGDDMISLSGDFSEIPAPYFFEASELNYIGGEYVYTYNTSWDKRLEWKNKYFAAPPACSMVYMKTATPLDSESWEYCGHYFKNPGEMGLEYSNNHTHLQKYEGRYYLLYHSLFPQKSLGTTGGFRSLCVNEIDVDEENAVISETRGTKNGTEQIKNPSPYKINQGETIFTSAGIVYNPTDKAGNMTVSGSEKGAWSYVKGMDFSKGAAEFAAKVKGKGRIEVYADSLENEYICAVEFDSGSFGVVTASVKENIKGVHDLYFVLSGDSTEFDEWQFTGK